MAYRVIDKDTQQELIPGGQLHSYTGVWYFHSVVSPLKIKVVSSWEHREGKWPEVKVSEFVPEIFGLVIESEVETALKALDSYVRTLPEYYRDVHVAQVTLGTLGLIDWLTAFPEHYSRVIASTHYLHMYLENVKSHRTDKDDTYPVIVTLETKVRGLLNLMRAVS